MQPGDRRNGCCTGGSTRGRVRGFTFVWALAAIALLSLGLAQVGPLWADQAKREREAELLRIGKLYAQALARYHDLSPGTLKRYPDKLDALLLDDRFLGTQRYLRKLYTDPLKPGQPWGLVREEDGTISGVFSTSTDAPLRRESLDLGVTLLPAAAQYSSWRFTPETRTSSLPSTATSKTSSPLASRS
jgi:hypothetical protein